MKPRLTRKRTVKSEIAVSAEIVQGAVSSDELVAWIQEAVERYFMFRAGFVGIAAKAAIKAVAVKNVTEGCKSISGMQQ